ncbi:hypothetical protein [Flavicella marina]|uniref:hypothetical protein n=1 Tax=Flavicella marina TaxID=1475951 RepID=UPI0012644987|nr:hypothetical protein [Flavicella marina]
MQPSNQRNLFIYLLLCIPFSFIAQNHVRIENNYNNWKWENIYVASNEFVSVAIVPEAAGRILEYNLGDAQSLWVNPKLFGKSFAPNEEVNGTKDWRNFGGYRIVPLPVSNCAIQKNGERSNRWPPPAMLGDNPYTATIKEQDSGEKAIEVVSGIQELPVPTYDRISKSYSYPKEVEEEIQYKRSLQLEAHSSLVHSTHSLHNKGKNTVDRGFMMTSQHLSRSAPELEDGENFLAYIPFSANDNLHDGKPYEIMATAKNHWNFVNRNRMPLDRKNPEHIKKYDNIGTNWTGEVAPGVYEIHYDYYIMAGFHIIASKPWVGFVNKTNMTAFVKLFEPLDKTKTYEENINVSIYNSALETGYLETEVRTPIHTLAPGQSFEYQETQAAAKIASLPILDVNRTGVITQKLEYTSKSKKITGKYGVFRSGQAVLKISNKDNTTKQIKLCEVNPLKSFVLDKKIKLKNDATTLEIWIIDQKGASYLLDTLKL